MRFTKASSTTVEQRREALAAGLTNQGDCILIWVNEEDLKNAQNGGLATEFVSAQEENLMPGFHELLREAHNAEEEYEMFDVHSENKESKAEWDRLRVEASKSKSKLIRYIRDNPSLLPQLLSSTQ